MRHGLVLDREAATRHRVAPGQACLAGTQDGARTGSPAEHAGFIERGLPRVGEPPLSRHDNGMEVRARERLPGRSRQPGTRRVRRERPHGRVMRTHLGSAPILHPCVDRGTACWAAGPTPYGTIHRPSCFPETRTDTTEAGARGTDADAVRHADRLAECGGASHAWRDG